MSDTIDFILVLDGKEYAVRMDKGQHISLMTLISDHLPISGFGLCSGMGGCGTCLVEIDGEPALSCGVPVNADLSDTIIVIQEARF
ncbi:(2Fe-2S)-binding protein [Dyadobacter sp. LJ53]|uniref:2Fe-2S iron-sulfur cluster-binding protein n=1 Tax=Dyadobacter chenwenxiniae TaxID=2906456 RepID=UPI001F46ABB8|nr:2Fe-2S iron-sulfur cluster-binding protein [Dyadobacter chenwenxiniae]MCF0050589.1 (2Fe-2S)-binding protein [Dyadobacter chenwenxiniae]